MVENVRASDTVARIGGDEFVVLFETFNRSTLAVKQAEKIADLIKSEVDPVNHSVTVSIGISLYPKNGHDPETLLKAADQAMYEAKNSDSPCKLA